MAITVSHGKGGSVTWTSQTQAYVESWSLSATVDTAPVTNMASTGDWEEVVAGHTDWTATVTILVDDGGILMGTSTALGQILTSAALVLGDGIRTITGTGIATNISLGVDSKGAVKATYTFQGNSALT